MEILAAPPPARPFTTLQRASYRIDSIDLLRGLIMIIMALDHTRDFFHREAWTGDPTDMATTTPILFFTRWITHFCAPIFVFLAGSSAWFQSLRKTKEELSAFLIKRGLWLVFVEIFILNFAFFFDPHYGTIGLQTIWSIAISMIILGLVIWLPFPVIVALGLAIVLGHNALDYYEKVHPQGNGVLYELLHQGGFRHLWANHNLLILYPFLPWTGLMMIGYCFGRLFTSYDGEQRKKLLTWIGFGVIALFIVLRMINEYGDPDPWSQQRNGVYTFMSFLNTHKYPPSLLYMCMTIGPALVFLAWFGNIKTGLAKVITVYGRVPFFYYILHFYLIHFISAIAFLARGHSISERGQGPLAPYFILPGDGYPLWVVYLVWIGVIVILYPVCKWFSEYKKTHTQWWLSYL